MGWFRWRAHLFGGGVCSGHAQYSAFVPGFFEATFGLFLSQYQVIQSLPQPTQTQSYFQSLIIFLSFKET